ncbi:hypothetical protein HMI54_004065 [Coelomomyces lativittatus]|nr:hypothetical protein HMI56_006643 [Coelomomyces lativittatus]KAJ1516083.1 hypothetical protein HMI55_003017 [Coelomomyces lativittatus]KAJ1517772.1 hypothetical protein HMI54_004065 [Coelomomyces lativittatus]
MNYFQYYFTFSEDHDYSHSTKYSANKKNRLKIFRRIFFLPYFSLSTASQQKFRYSKLNHIDIYEIYSPYLNLFITASQSSLHSSFGFFPLVSSKSTLNSLASPPNSPSIIHDFLFYTGCSGGRSSTPAVSYESLHSGATELIRWNIHYSDTFTHSKNSILFRISRSGDFYQYCAVNSENWFKIYHNHHVTSPITSRSSSPDPFSMDISRTFVTRQSRRSKNPEIRHVVRRLSAIHSSREKSPTKLDSLFTKWKSSSRSLRTIKLLLQSPKIINTDYESAQLRVHTSFLSGDYRTLYLHSLGPGIGTPLSPHVSAYYSRPVGKVYPY